MNIYEAGEWRNRIETILKNVEIPWELHLLEDKIFTTADGTGRLYLQVQFNDVDNTDANADYRSYCRKWYLSPYMTTQEVVRTAWLAYMGAVTHEASEKFKFKGSMIYGPHIEPDSLSRMAHHREIRPNHARPTEVQP